MVSEMIDVFIRHSSDREENRILRFKEERDETDYLYI